MAVQLNQYQNHNQSRTRSSRLSTPLPPFSFNIATPHPLPSSYSPQVILGDPVDNGESPPFHSDAITVMDEPTFANQPPPATITTPFATASSSSHTTYPSHTSPSDRPRGSREGFWKTVDSDQHGMNGMHSPGLVAHARPKREREIIHPDQDVEMRDIPIAQSSRPSTPPVVTTNRPINLVFRMPPAIPALPTTAAPPDAVSASTASSPETTKSGTGSKKKLKRKSEPPLNPNRITRGRRSSPQFSTPRVATPDESSPAPSVASLSIFAPPPPADILPQALQSALTPSIPALAPVEDQNAPLVDADIIRREAAAGFETRLRPRGTPRDGGERTGVSASGKDVRVGGSSRAAAQQVVPNGQSKKKGKGKSGERDVPNQDMCSSCRGIGRFLCCDGCPRSFHFMCLEPPLRVDELPEEETWYCKECQARRDKEGSDSPVKGKELKPIPMAFKKLYQTVEEKNPSQYRLPDEVRLHFAGVSEGAGANYGEYVDTEEARMKFDRKGFQEERDPLRTQYKNRPVQCFACGGSSLPLHSLTSDPESTWRQIISCDYCPLHWHLDCLTPPLASMPNSGRKWMCPNHVEQVMPRRRAVRNGLETVEIDSTNMRNNGNITIVPDVETPKLPPLEYEDMVINKKTFRVPERIIKLDFWEKLKSTKKGGLIRPESNTSGRSEDVEMLSEPPSEEDMNAANLILALFQGTTNATQITSDPKLTVEKEGDMIPKPGTPKTKDNKPDSPIPQQPENQLATPITAVPLIGTTSAPASVSVSTSAHIVKENKPPKIMLRMPAQSQYSQARVNGSSNSNSNGH